MTFLAEKMPSPPTTQNDQFSLIKDALDITKAVLLY